MGEMETELSSTFVAHKYEYIHCRSLQNGVAANAAPSSVSRAWSLCMCSAEEYVCGSVHLVLHLGVLLISLSSSSFSDGSLGHSNCSFTL